MQITISSRHFELRADSRDYVESNLSKALERFAERPTGANAVLVKDAKHFGCEITVHLSTGLTAQARASSPILHKAFDAACEKLVKQLRRYKRRLKNHHNERTVPVSYSGAVSSVLAASPGGQDEPESLAPVIIAETETRIPTLSVGEAVMQLEIAEEALLVFRNQRHGEVNIVHRRDDGNIGWIDPGSGG
ncbi:MAG: ribosome-associated translation inhibitor RaiA [Rhodobacteraceae bacterium]|nr:ribosome-associated translation inhibitor RaiA [Paracoccaceae bacterium]